MPEENNDFLGNYPDKFLNNLLAKVKANPNHIPIILGYSKIIEEKLSSLANDFLFILPGNLKENINLKNRHVIQDEREQNIIKKLTFWQKEHLQGKPFLPITIPYFWKKYSSFYQPIFKILNANYKFNFWEKAKYRKFTAEPKILLITSKYFLIGEIITACKKLDYQYYLLHLENQEIGSEEFIKLLLKAILEFKPDFILTINHLGVDKEGILMDLLEKLELPLASWFVDNPHLILYMYHKVKSNYSVIFTWDIDNISLLKERGFSRVYYLPLATDTTRFNPKNNLKIVNRLSIPISFVGNSMYYKVKAREEKLLSFETILQHYKQVAFEFKDSDYLVVSDFLRDHYPNLYQLWLDLPSIESKLDLETLITWQSTLEYRLENIKEILSFRPVIVGDRGWFKLLKANDLWSYHQELNYYTELPYFYGQSKINFNATSAQMKGAVNQRVFDVPASGNFLLTDYRYQIEHLFEAGKEVIYYKDKSEIKELVKFYLNKDSERNKIIEKARKRIISEHTYENRLKTLYSTMSKLFN
ncbi:MAG: spore maturation protein CgeB [Desulfonauticus sp.]|nr:spore maturation protein CgeB [Desulfonauticus sp.]